MYSCARGVLCCSLCGTSFKITSNKSKAHTEFGPIRAPEKNDFWRPTTSKLACSARASTLITHKRAPQEDENERSQNRREIYTTGQTRYFDGFLECPITEQTIIRSIFWEFRGVSGRGCCHMLSYVASRVAHSDYYPHAMCTVGNITWCRALCVPDSGQD